MNNYGSEPEGVNQASLFISEYQKNFNDNVDDCADLVILGSFGRNCAKENSDLDAWIIMDAEYIPLEDSHRIVLEEKKVRLNLAPKYGFINSFRHYATVMTQLESEEYLDSLQARFGLPRIHNEHLNLTRTESFNPVFDPETLRFDIGASIEERIENYFRADDEITRYKWISLIANDLYYLSSGNFTSDANERAKVIQEIFDNNPDNILNQSISLIDNLKTEDPELFKTRRLMHQVTWTLEKVRWELINSFENPEYFDKWRVSEQRDFGFTPVEISRLLMSLSEHFGFVSFDTKELGSALIKISREKPEISLEELNHTLTVWYRSTLKTLKNSSNKKQKQSLSGVFPTIHDGQKTITRLTFGKGQRFAISEFYGYRKISPGQIIDFKQSDSETKVSIVDFKGNTVNDLNSEIVSKMGNYLRSMHFNSLEKFGRLGSPEINTNTYTEYLLSRLKSSKIPDQTRAVLIDLVLEWKFELDNSVSVLSHMDSGPRNWIIQEDGNLRLIDFEHASGCSKYFDIHRALMQLPVEFHADFIEGYQDEIDLNSIESRITEVVMKALFYSNYKRWQDLKDLMENIEIKSRDTYN